MLDFSQVNAGPSRTSGGSASRAKRRYLGRRGIDFGAINDAALAALPKILTRWLPDGRPEGHEYVARNPKRDDRKLGSFKINMRTGRWSDFSTGDSGGDPISLAAYLFNLNQGEAAQQLAVMLGLSSHGSRESNRGVRAY